MHNGTCVVSVSDTPKEKDVSLNKQLPSFESVNVIAVVFLFFTQQV